METKQRLSIQKVLSLAKGESQSQQILVLFALGKSDPS
jgi:hypothetical protein